MRTLRSIAVLAAHLALIACSSKPAPTTTPPPSPPDDRAVAPPAPPPPAAPTKPQLAGVYTEDVDRSVDPCTDFYEFANGAWRKANPIPASMPRWSRRWQAGETSKERLKDILEPIAAKPDWKPGSVEQLIGDFYASCMDEAKAAQLGIEPVKPLLAEIAAIKDRAGIVKILPKLHALGVGVPFGVHAEPDLHEPTNVIAYVTASGLGLPDRDYYVKPDKRFADARTKYQAHVQTMFTLAGYADKDAKQAAKAVFALETKLAKASLDNVALRDPKSTDHKLTVAALQKLSPKLDWTAYFTAAHVPLAPLNVNEPAFVKEIDRQLAATSIADWRTYLTWHVLVENAAYLAPKLYDEQFAFYGTYLSGAQEMKPRWKRCVEATDGLLGEALGQKYVEKYFPPAAKARMQELVKNLLAAMKDDIERIDWMSAPTKQRALEKLATFNPKIGYPDKWKDYSAIPIKRDTLFANVAAARAWNVDDDHGTIGKPLDRGRWGMTPPTSDAYYNPALNEIVFPAGILQPPAFRLDAADPINYGAIGVVIGHEISHGFDDQGAKFDAQGRLENWWTAEDEKHFRERGQCVADLYESYFVEPGLHHNGKLVLGEAIGDFGGLNLAYRAFQKAQAKSPTPTIDGLTPDQQFFIAWGQFRGDAIRIEQQRLMIQGDPHPIAKYRVIGPISNLPDFARTFSCKPDAAMVRPAAKRCEVW
ncbi:MAG TPA: M13 family metallopeptidase [Kofleriaceae bacterium]|nr:M13 family metallopeptidase [Kofleriaceae bacterium]